MGSFGGEVGGLLGIFDSECHVHSFLSRQNRMRVQGNKFMVRSRLMIANYYELQSHVMLCSHLRCTSGRERWQTSVSLVLHVLSFLLHSLALLYRLGLGAQVVVLVEPPQILFQRPHIECLI